MHRRTCWALLAVVSLVAAVAYFAGVIEHVHLLMVMTKPIPVVAMMLAVLIARPIDRHDWAILLGLGFSLCGDVALSLSGDHFIEGLVAFLIGHICYVIGFLAADERGRPPLSWVRGIPMMLVGIAGIAFLWPGLGALAIPVCIYVGVLVTMTFAAACRVGHGQRHDAQSGRAEWLGLIGAVTFLASDTSLAVGKFRFAYAAEPYLVMVTYWVGQLGIALSCTLRPRAKSAGV